MDPRIFLILPEHVSNAHHIWNYALFISQMSNLNNLDNASSILKSHMKKSPINNKTITDLIASKGESSEANLCLLESLMNDLYLNDLKHDYLKLNNEPIMTILKIKKRNKASLFNLILPPALSYIASSSTSTTTTTQNTSKLDTFKSTTPWLSKDKSLSLATDQDLGNNNNKQDIDSASSTSSTSSSSLDYTANQSDKLDNDNNNNNNDEIMVDNLIDYDYNEGCRR